MADLPMVIPRRDSIWRCPCGMKGPMSIMSGHRKGYKNHPGCMNGKLVMVNAGSPDEPPLWRSPVPRALYPDDDASPLVVNEPAPLQSEPALELPVDALPDIDPILDTKPANTAGENGAPYEFIDRDLFTDPEAVAKLYNERRFKVAPLSGETPPDGGGNGHSGEPLEPGDYHLEGGLPQPAVSFIREPVNLPVIVKVMYDWAREQGWNQGDGSMSTFVTDMLMDHFRNCIGMAVVVVRKEEFHGIG